MDGGTVRIRSKNRSTNWKKSVRGVLHTRRIESIHLAGTGSIRSASIRAESLKATISGAGKIQFRRLDAKDVRIVISGTGAVDLGSGRVEELGVTVTGAGDVIAGKLRSDAGKVAISGPAPPPCGREDARRAHHGRGHGALLRGPAHRRPKGRRRGQREAHAGLARELK